ncbi:hypothetical protein KT99_00431 [Shewanella benthica KT99]|uniref:Uncharacterized protein n=1 Tax=Shewanella benthica KT99 TaxID=314608 RepID=A9DN83_9GAMM|nr:hypothetical protein KT99_00431 [Shewanella benthica KT99]
MAAELIAVFDGAAKAVVGNRLLMTNIKAVINFIVFSFIPLV